MKINNLKQSLFLSIFSFLLTILVILLQIFMFCSNVIQSNAKMNNVLSIYNETNYDYIINQPSKEQIEEFNNNKSIDKVIPFYKLALPISIQGDEVHLNLKSIDDIKDINYTEFNEKRIAKEKGDNGIYIDYSFSNKYNLKLGDKIGKGKFTFTIKRIYKNADRFIAFVPNLKELFDEPLSPAGVYVVVNDETNFKSTIIDTYKPMATLKSRDLFSDDKAYQNYLEEFNNRDYSDYINKKMDGYNEALESYNNEKNAVKSGYIKGAIISSLILLVGLMLWTIVNIKKVKTEVVSGGRKEVNSRYIISSIVSLVAIIISWFISVAIKTGNALYYISIIDVLSSGLVTLLLPIIVVILSLVINIVVSAGYKEKTNKR